MKKYLTSFLFLCLICVLVTGCKNSEAQQSGVSNSSPQTVAGQKQKKADVDLTVLGSTMVYAEVYNMMTKPEDYIGKTVKANGPYVTSFYEGSYYHFVLVDGADSCCPEGLMFVWSGEHTYPEEETKIEIVGIFGSYEDFDFPYYYLAVDDITILE